MTDRWFLAIYDPWALAHDRLQWKVRKHPAGGWRDGSRANTFLATDRRALRRVLREKGAHASPKAQKAVNRFSATFRDCHYNPRIP